MAKRFGKVKSYEDWIEPKIVSNTLELLDDEIPKLKSRIKSVQLCFTTDPFMYGHQDIEDMSLAAIKKLNSAGIGCSILTKGIPPLALSELSPINTFGITLISLDENYRKRIEPGASPYAERIEALRRLHNLGCKTWVSIEPYPTPNINPQDIFSILRAIDFTDRIIFGRTNYNKTISAYKNHKTFYNSVATKVMRFCAEHEIDCYIKRGTIANALEERPDDLSAAPLSSARIAVV
jgi:DNA repair photolyase